MLSGGSVAEIVITITEAANLNISAIISAEKKDSRLVKDVSNIIAPLMLATASAEIANFFNI
jgi:predicted site-specific integrase-resolvase